MAINELSGVRAVALSIVTKGANRKRFFLRKEAEHEDLIELPSSQRILKAADWSAVYCVVAEPGALEDPGIHGDQEIPDRWASEDEIRKTAHDFVKGGGLINLLHESLEPHGQLVESAIALGDFEVDGETIRKGSWYVAFEPNEETKAEIEEGTFGGISLQGTGTRTLVEKALDEDLEKASGYICSNCGNAMSMDEARPRARCPSCRHKFRNSAPGELLTKCSELLVKDAILVPNIPGKTNWVERAGGLPKFIADIAGDLITEKGKSVSNAIQIAVGVVKNWCSGQGKVTAATRAKACAAAAAWEKKKASAKISKGLLGEAKELADDEELIDKAGRFDEAKHPRKGGKFAPKGTAAGAATPKGTKAKTKSQAQQNRDNTAANILSSLGDYKGMKLSDAVRAFQKKHGLQETGEVDAGTLKTMRAKEGGTRKKRRAKRQKPKGRLVAKESSADAGTMGDRVERGLLTKIAEKLGLSAEEIKKAYSTTFSERMAERDFEDELPQAFDVLRSVVCGAFYPSPADSNPPDPAQVIADSLDEFKAWALDLLESTPVSKIAEQISDAEEWSLEKAQLSAADRKKLPKSAFVFPDKSPGAGSYPIHDLAHAKNAKARASGKPEEKKVFAAVHRRFPQLKPKKMAKAASPVADRAAQVKQALAAAKKAYPDGIPASVRKKIFKDPAAYLASGKVAKESTTEIPKVEDMDDERTETSEETSVEDRLDVVEEMLSKLDPDRLAETVAKAVKDSANDDAPTPESVQKSVEELGSKVTDAITSIKADIEKLGAGGSAQRTNGDEPVEKSEGDKAYAGIL